VTEKATQSKESANKYLVDAGIIQEEKKETIFVAKPKK